MIYLIRLRKDYYVEEDDKKQLGNVAVGIVEGYDIYDLFWNVDEYCNPYACEFLELPNFSMFFKNTNKKTKRIATCPKLPLLQNKKEEEYDDKIGCQLSILREERLLKHIDFFGEITNREIYGYGTHGELQEWDSFVNHKKFINKCMKEESNYVKETNNIAIEKEKESA